MSVNNFTSRKEGILNTFNQAAKDLSELNKDIDKAIEGNAKTIKAFQNENKQLVGLKESNNKTIKFFNSIFK